MQLWRAGIWLVAGTAVAIGSAAYAQNQTPPYWASIKSGDAIVRSGATLRAGPSQNMRALWVYHRPGLPVQVIAVHDDWRQIREPDGTTGWMHRSLITGRRTAIVTGGDTGDAARRHRQLARGHRLSR